MLRSMASKVMWVGRAAVFMVGLSVIAALVLGVASTALGADGKSFLLGRTNLATAVTTLAKQGVGPALSLRVDSGPPLAVNSSAKVSGLNADTVDGRDSTDFAEKRSEAWHEVGTDGEPKLHPQYRADKTPAFYKDPLGVVYLRGVLQETGERSAPSVALFTLPAGYRPATLEYQGKNMNVDPGVRILPSGEIMVDVGGGAIYLDGVAFRAAN
jgi:hypothetical protein